MKKYSSLMFVLPLLCGFSANSAMAEGLNKIEVAEIKKSLHLFNTVLPPHCPTIMLKDAREKLVKARKRDKTDLSDRLLLEIADSYQKHQCYPEAIKTYVLLIDNSDPFIAEKAKTGLKQSQEGAEGLNGNSGGME